MLVTDAQKVEHEDEIRDIFLRLQNGTTLKAQEKRNARSRSMRDFVKTVAGHPFFEHCRFNNSRFTFDHVAAQTILIEINGSSTNVKDADLNRMYESQEAFDKSGEVAKKVKKTYEPRQRLNLRNVINCRTMTYVITYFIS